MPSSSSFLKNAILHGVLVAATLGQPLLAAEGQSEPPQKNTTGQDVAALIAKLDSNRYEVRQQAVEALEALVARPNLGPLLSAEFQRALLRPEVSFEVRYYLGVWQKRLPKATAEPPGEMSREEIDRLVRRLDDDSYAARLGADERLRWAAKGPRLAEPIMHSLRRQLGEEGLSAEVYRRLESVLETVRGEWLCTDPAQWSLFPVSAEQLDHWIDELARAGADKSKCGPWGQPRIARQELMDLLARDADVPRVKAALQSRLDRGPSAAAAAQLKELLDLTRPAMVVEFWQRRHMIGQQHLIVGVPDQPAGAARPVQFGPVNDRTAHCVSANTLKPGTDYPVGVAFPNPTLSNTAFHLVYLGVPRQRMAYSHLAKGDEARRLADISRRTLERFLAEKHRLTDGEAALLALLDPREVSRFAGQYLARTADESVADDFERDDNPFDFDRSRSDSGSSRNGMICAQLAVDGTNEAVPGLLEAIRKNHFAPPSAQAPCRLQWLAALSIARRDPWPDVDRWLAEVVGRTEVLVQGKTQGPELGATAAAILLLRHGRNPADFGLQEVVLPAISGYGVPGHRYSSAERSKAVESWWQRRDKGKTT